MSKRTPGLLQRFVRSMRDLRCKDLTALVAVSGGADSMSMLDLTLRARKTLNLDVHIVHLDHGWRDSSALDAGFVGAFARANGLPFHCERAVGLPISEESGRNARLDFYVRTGIVAGASCVLIGHSADDQAETVIQRLLRGAGGDGLSGMQSRTKFTIEAGEIALIRPLLAFRREELRAYCHDREVTYQDDPSNENARFLRNRIRHEIIPLLEDVVPGATSAITRMAEILASDCAYINNEAAEAWTAAVLDDGHPLTVDRKVFRTLPLAIQRALLRRIGEILLGPSSDLSFERIESARRSIEGLTGGIVVQWPAPVELRVLGGRAHFYLESSV